MEKDQIIILKNRGLISIFGDDANEFLQSIITNAVSYTHLTLPTNREV